MMKTKYKKKYDNIIFELKLAGKSNKFICNTLGITIKTFYSWMKEHNNFKNIYEVAKNAKVDAKKALIKRAIGYNYTEEKYVDGVLKEKHRKHCQADISAIKYLLQNVDTFDKELEHKIWLDKEKLENEKFERWFDINEKKVHEKIKEIYEKGLL